MRSFVQEIASIAAFSLDFKESGGHRGLLRQRPEGPFGGRAGQFHSGEVTPRGFAPLTIVDAATKGVLWCPTNL